MKRFCALLGLVIVGLATVCHELAASGHFLLYRRNYGDHFPVAVTILVGNDID